MHPKRGITIALTLIRASERELKEMKVSLIVAEGQKPWSCVKSTKLKSMKSELTSQMVFVRNMQLLFKPPVKSKPDSPAAQNRKHLTYE
ncbi:hypothetical protein N8T08_000972 [Aspergillus melleus]|uniref:Uncharacterized protein n=1 Tax=Aspergillus melleus TaxID=138277 RepID=A0ACC3BBL4_9EURO|nr:hypothetical protein N8T08_000972 [Aspergillus melleus]